MSAAIETTERRARTVLWIDGGAAFVGGLAVLLLHDWLAPLYRVPTTFIVVVGIVNLVYASYSGSLARRASAGRWPSRRAVDVLIVANLCWVVVCLALVLAMMPSASIFGLGHFALEGAFVGALALAERRHVRPRARDGNLPLRP